jgi:TRAP-type C4-dicarboxylate transport system substrate-binding protein
MKLRGAALAGLLLMTGLVPAPARAAVPHQTWQCYTYDSAATDPLYLALLKLGAEINKASGGSIALACHPGGALPINVENIAQSISQGVLQFGLVDSLSYNSVVPAAEVLSLPGLYGNESELGSAVTALTPLLKPQFAARDIVMLGVANYPLQVLWSTRKLTTLADLKGMKIRVTTPDQAQFAVRFGATPITLGMPDVPTSLQRGVIQGVLTANVGGGIVWHGLLRYNLRTGPNYVSIMLLVNKKVFDALPPALQKTIASLSADEAGKMTSLLQGRETALTAQFKKQGLIVTPGTPADAAAIKARMQPYLAQWAKASGPTAAKALSTVEQTLKQ